MGQKAPEWLGTHGQKAKGSRPFREHTFFEASRKRLREAKFLLDNAFTTAAVYLAGYAVECAVKSLILSSEPSARNAESLDSFRGQRAHSLEWLRHQLLARKVLLPQEMIKNLTSMNVWATDLRYDPKDVPEGTAIRFIKLAEEMCNWTQRRQ